MAQLTHVFVLLAALSSVGTAQNFFFTDGDERTFEVRPSVTEEITSILWKHNKDLVADWPPLEIYSRFQNRTTLDTTTGRLVIKRMTKDDEGRYTMEVNNVLRSGNYDMKWIQRVNKPGVHVRTLTCSFESDKCNVTCEGGTEEAGTIEYYWKIGSSEWKNLGKDFEITKEEHGGEKFIACRMKNPISEEESEPINNPLLAEPSLSTGEIVGISFSVIVIIIAVSVAAYFGVPWILKRWRSNPDPTVTPPVYHQNSTEEGVPLKPNPSV